MKNCSYHRCNQRNRRGLCTPLCKRWLRFDHYGWNTGKLENLKKNWRLRVYRSLPWLSMYVTVKRQERLWIIFLGAILMCWSIMPVWLVVWNLSTRGSFEDWDQMIDTNIKDSSPWLVWLFLVWWSCNHGHIINIGSVAGDAYAGW